MNHDELCFKSTIEWPNVVLICYTNQFNDECPLILVRVLVRGKTPFESLHIQSNNEFELKIRFGSQTFGLIYRILIVTLRQCTNHYSGSVWAPNVPSNKIHTVNDSLFNVQTTIFLLIVNQNFSIETKKILLSLLTSVSADLPIVQERK